MHKHISNLLQINHKYIFFFQHWGNKSRNNLKMLDLQTVHKKGQWTCSGNVIKIAQGMLSPRGVSCVIAG